MVQIEVLESSPVYLCGLVQVLNDDDVEIVRVRTKPDVDDEILADVYLVDICALVEIGEHATIYISRVAKQCRVLILTPTQTFDSGPFLDAGAVRSVSKQDGAEALIQSIRAANDAAVDEGTAGRHVQNQRLPTLSDRESEVLRYISWGFTHLQTARRLDISPHTVDTYVKRIRAKLKVGNKAQLARAAVLCGHLELGSPVLESGDLESMAQCGIPTNVTGMWSARDQSPVPPANGAAETASQPTD